MKQLFIALVVINLCLLMLQGAGNEAPDVPVRAPAPESNLAAASQPALAAGIKKLGKEVGKEVEEKRDHDQGSAPPPAEVAAPVPATETEFASEFGKSDEFNAQTTAEPDAYQLGEVGNIVVRNCVIAGPFRDKGQAQALISRLADTEIEAQLQPRNAALLPDYMVYVGPEDTAAKAKEVAAEFASQNIDSHVIGRGNLRNALSLGVFSRAAFAQSLHQKLKSEGYKANIVTIERNRQGFQVLTSLTPKVRSQLAAADTPLIDCPVAPTLAEASR